jgi:hypothetical protein
MKYNISKFLLVALSLVLGILACQKQSNPYYANGTTPVLSSTTTSIAAKPADSLSKVLVLNWTNPNYATNAASQKFTIQIDSGGRNFSKAVDIVVSGVLTDTFTAKQINEVALGMGFAYNVAYNMDVRVVSSYANNNEQLPSNMITISVTPYVIPPKVQPPLSGELYVVGDATQGGWNNPVPTPSQQFEKIDSVHYGGVFKLVGGKQYLMLPKNGDWSNKYAVASGTVPAAGGPFGYNGSNNTYNTNFNGPANDGWYTIMVDFQQGTFSVNAYSQLVPDSLFLVGDATMGGWNNPVPEPSQVFTRINSSQFSITLPLNGGKQYLMLPVNGDWSNKFAVASGTVPATGGPFGYNGNNGTYNTNFNGPAVAGTYTITADFLNYQYKVTQ